MRLEPEDDLVGRPATIGYGGLEGEFFFEPCHWIAPNICSAPPCVDRAYRELCGGRILQAELVL